MYTLRKHLASAPGLNEGDQGEILSRMYVVHATLLREKPDLVAAKGGLEKGDRLPLLGLGSLWASSSRILWAQGLAFCG
jgi:hypothetical protein